MQFAGVHKLLATLAFGKVTKVTQIAPLVTRRKSTLQELLYNTQPQLRRVRGAKLIYHSQTRLSLEGFLLNYLKGSGTQPPAEVPPTPASWFPRASRAWFPQPEVLVLKFPS